METFSFKIYMHSDVFELNCHLSISFYPVKYVIRPIETLLDVGVYFIE